MLLSGLNIVVYDCEIENLVPREGESRDADIDYCKGWQDYSGMGISVIGAYDYLHDRSRVFMTDNMIDFQALIDRATLIIGFNNLNFDDNLVAAHGIIIPPAKSFDIKHGLLIAAGIPANQALHYHPGYSLNATARANVEGLKKSGHGAMAPVNWQRGNTGSVVDYCLGDVHVTKSVLDVMHGQGGLWDPVNTGCFRKMSLNLERRP